MVTLWLVQLGQKLLLCSALSAACLAAALLLWSLWVMLVNYARHWWQLRTVPTVAGAYPFVGHGFIAERDSQGKKPHRRERAAIPLPECQWGSLLHGAGSCLPC